MVGPIGAGKSSILDAVSFALYGRTASVARDTGDLINQRADRALVELVFEVEGAVWRAVRGQTRKGQPPHQLSRLDEHGDTAEVIATSKSQMNAEIERLLGLNFDAFGRSVLLAQNRFAQFLEATTGDRDRVLKGIFELDAVDRAQAVAKARLATVDLELRDHDRKRAEIAEARSRLTEARERLEVARARHNVLKKAAPVVRRNEKGLETAEREEAEAARAIDELGTIGGRLPDGADLETAVGEVASAERSIADARTAVERTAAAATTAKEALDLTIEDTGGEAAIAEARSLLARLTEQAKSVDGASERLRKIGAEIRDAERTTASADAGVKEREAKLERVDADLARATGEVTSASEALDVARHAEMALSLRSGLQTGAVCPVCEQPVHEVPRVGRIPKIATAEQRLAKSTAREAALRRTREDLAAELAAARAEIASHNRERERRVRDAETAEEALAAAESEASVTRTALVARLGDGDPASSVAGLQRRLAAARAASDEAAARLSAEKDALEAAHRVAAEKRKEVGALVAEIARAAGALGVELETQDDAASIRRSFKEVAAALDRRRNAATKALDKARTRTTRATEALAGALADVGVDDTEGFERALQSAAVERGAAQTEVDVLRDRVADERALKGRIAETVHRRELLQRLTEDLAPSRFLRFLLEEDRTSLAQLGSEHCEQLTNGRYRFTEDGAFNVVDLAAAEGIRKSDSLSGGETFLASLALALALAEMVARGGGRLDAFFLDEGFGSLDPEHLDLAMEGIDRLVADETSRLVVLVSHVPEMRQRIEDLIVLDKDPVTGETVVRSGARAPLGSA